MASCICLLNVGLSIPACLRGTRIQCGECAVMLRCPQASVDFLPLAQGVLASFQGLASTLGFVGGFFCLLTFFLCMCLLGSILF